VTHVPFHALTVGLGTGAQKATALRAMLEEPVHVGNPASLLVTIRGSRSSAIGPPPGLSEAEQMKAAWDESEALALLEVAGRNTAENASRSLPFLLAIGDVRRVTVVSSVWHIRVPWFFAPYRRFGLDVDYRVSIARARWPRLLRELKEARRAPEERRRAMAAAPRRP
jgi:hypothetical protein